MKQRAIEESKANSLHFYCWPDDLNVVTLDFANAALRLAYLIKNYQEIDVFGVFHGAMEIERYLGFGR